MQQGSVIFEKPAQHGLRSGADDRIVADCGDTGVKGHVGLDEGNRVGAHLGGLFINGRAQGCHILGRCAFGSQPDKAQFEHPARLFQMLAVCGDQIQQHARDIIAAGENRCRINGLHPRPFAMRDGDEALLMQRLQRLAHCRAAYAKTIHQGAFGRHGIAGVQLSAADHREKPVEHLIGKLAADDPVGSLCLPERSRHTDSPLAPYAHIRPCPQPVQRCPLAWRARPVSDRPKKRPKDPADDMDHAPRNCTAGSHLDGLPARGADIGRHDRGA